MNNKHITYHILTLLLLMLSLASGLMSCSEKDVPTVLTPDDLFTVTEVRFEGIAGEQSHAIEFEAPEAWTSEVHCLGSWLKADAYRGDKGKAVINISPKSDNFGVTAREATLEIYIDGMEAYTVKVYQESASTGDIQVGGHVDNGVMTLLGNDTGTEFSDTIYVTSTKRWTLKADADVAQVLSFETDGESMNGTETTVRVIVKAAYNKFAASAYEGKFYIQTDEGTAVPLSVKAMARVAVFDMEKPMQNEAERVSFQLVDTIKTGTYMTSVFVESNIRWTLGNMPEWIESTADKGSITNVSSSGKLVTGRKHLTFYLKKSELSRDGKTGVIELLDVRGEVVKKINVTYAGVGSNYVMGNLAFRGEDPMGNPWGFEANSKYIDPNNEADYWKEVSHDFDVVTSASYSSVSDAPFHLLLVKAEGGMPRKQEVHWAELDMPQGAFSRTGDLYSHKMTIRVSNRGDADDQKGITNATEWRYAFVYIVPTDVTFADLWDGNQLKAKYADDMLIMAQKNDPAANYTFAFREVQNGGTVTAPAAGGAVTLNVVPGSFSQCDMKMQLEGKDGTWTTIGSDICAMDYTRKGEELSTVTFTLSENKKVTNPFTHQTTSAPRHIRVTIIAFLGDNEGEKTIFEFYIDQAVNE